MSKTRARSSNSSLASDITTRTLWLFFENSLAAEMIVILNLVLLPVRLTMIPFICNRVDLPHVASLNPVCQFEALPMDWLIVLGNIIALPFAVCTVSMVRVPVASRVNTRSVWPMVISYVLDEMKWEYLQKHMLAQERHKASLAWDLDHQHPE